MAETPRNILEQIQSLHYAISTESRLVRVGLKDEQNLAGILSRYPALTEPGTALRLKQIREESDNDEDREKISRAYFYCLGHHIHSELAAEDDRVTTFLSRATVAVDGETLPYHELHPRLSREPDFARRERLGAGFHSVHGQVNDLLAEILRRETGILTGLFGFPGYIGYCEEKKRLDYGKLAAMLEASLARTGPLYSRGMGDYVLARFGRPYEGLWRVHVPYLLRMRDFDRYFPKAELFAKVNAALGRMGIDFTAYPNILLDLEERPRKNPRACCFTSRVPEEIHLIVKPVGGLKDYETFLHEGGHALHYGNTRSDLPYEYRELTQSYALSETYAFLFQNLTMNPAWLADLEVPPDAAAAIRRERILIDLFMYRRYIGKFLAELEFFRKGDLKDARIYARRLREATGFYYEPSAYLTDLDAEFYSLDYLRAWIDEAQLEHHLRKCFGASWPHDRGAGDFLKEQWRSGEKGSPESLLAGLGYDPFDVTYLEKRFEELT
jgi:hypothetical protein